MVKAFALTGTYLVLQPIRFTRAPCHHGGPWALTPHFHPYPDSVGTVIFCGTCYQVPACAGTSLPVRKYGALCCPDFPLPHGCGSGRAGRRPGQRYGKNWPIGWFQDKANNQFTFINVSILFLIITGPSSTFHRMSIVWPVVIVAIACNVITDVFMSLVLLELATSAPF